MRHYSIRFAAMAVLFFWINFVQTCVDNPLCRAEQPQELKDAKEVHQQKFNQLNESYKRDLIKIRSKFLTEGKLDEAAAVNEEIINLSETASAPKTTAAPAAALKDNLVLHFPFNEKPQSNALKDASGKGNDGEITGAAWTSEGVPQGAFKFDIKQMKNAIRVKNNESLDMQNFTLSAWIRSKDKDGFWNRIFDKDWKHGYDLCLGGDVKGKSYRGQVVLEVMGQAVVSKGNAGDGKWHLINGTYDGNALKVYIDGKLDNARNWRGKIGKNDKDLVIGNTRTDIEDEMQPFDGLIGEVRIYSRALTEEEIRQLWESGKPSADK